MAAISIRKATPEDVDSIYHFVCKLEDKVFDKSLFHPYYLENIRRKDYYYLVATNDAQPIGYLSCHGQLLLHHMNYVYEIQELFVEAEYRGMGIGKLLIEHLEMLLQDKDYDMLEVASNMKRTASHEFYKASGFSQSHYKFTKAADKK